MPSTYKVKTALLSSGERLPMLLAQDTGEPVFLPTLFVLQTLRATNRAANTIEQALRSILVLLSSLDELTIDLCQRMQTGLFLSIGDVDHIVKSCAFTAADKTPNGQASNVVPIKTERSTVSSKTAATRLAYISSYLEWLVANYLARQSTLGEASIAAKAAADVACRALRARIPKTNNSSLVTGREGLEKDVMKALKLLILPDSPGNPWAGCFTKKRNQLLIDWLMGLGLRRGELLGVRIRDINFQKNTVQILRRADDSSDIRRSQPNAKTRDREIPLSPGLAQMTHDYIVHTRSAIQGARKHDFLFIASGTGKPLSLIAVNKVFEDIRVACPNMPRDLSPHLLRHSWNDAFSALADKNKITPEDEQKMRSYLMGWSETSGTAANYTKRHNREAAQKISLTMQKTMMGEDADD